MPQFNFTFQEASPLVTYRETSDWVEGSNADPFFHSYDGSFRVANSRGAQATLVFNGTGYSLFGAMRPNHGDYAVSLDNNPTILHNGTATPELFKFPLSQGYGLPYQQHTVQVTNEPTSPNNNFFDLDFVQIERTVGGVNDPQFTFNIDDTSPLVTYGGLWQPSLTMASSNYNGTLHETSQNDSTLNITFQGCCIELYGVYTNAGFAVAVDGGLPIQMQGQDIDIAPDTWHPQTLLYLNDGLSDNTTHILSLTTTFANSQRPFFFDNSVLRSTTNFSDPSQLLPTPVNNASKQTPVAAVVGASIGGVVVISLLLAAYIIWRRRRRVQTSVEPDAMTEPGNSRQAQRGWNLSSRNRISSPQAVIDAWYPPTGNSSQAQDNHGEVSAGHVSSGTTNASPPNDFNPYLSKRRANLRGQTVPVARSATNFASHVRGQSGSGVSEGTSNLSSLGGTLSQSSPSHGSQPQSVVTSSPSGPQDQRPSAVASISTTREEDAGVLYREGQAEILPPAYNTGWNVHQS